MTETPESLINNYIQAMCNASAENTFPSYLRIKIDENLTWKPHTLKGNPNFQGILN